MKDSKRSKKTRERDLLAESFDWESGKRGRYSSAASQQEETTASKALGLQLISIRLPQDVIERLKFMAKKEGVGYQPYTRQVLTRHTQGKESTTVAQLEDRVRTIEKALFKK